MKISKNTRNRAYAVTVAMAAGLLFASEASADVYQVQLELNQDQTKLEAITRGQCAQKDHPGCVEVGKGKHGDLQFILTGNKQCDKADGAKWGLTQVFLGGKNSPEKPLAWGDLDAEVIADFDVADAGSGLLNNDSGSNDSLIKISDKNQSAYDIWYTVVANCVGPDGSFLGTLKLDPRVKNVGR